MNAGKILTEIGGNEKDILKKQRTIDGIIEVDVLFNADQSLYGTGISFKPPTVDNVNDWIQNQVATIEMVKNLDHDFFMAGFRGKKIKAHTYHERQDGRSFLESDEYAIALIK